jgi:hypothetical protein
VAAVLDEARLLALALRGGARVGWWKGGVLL